MAELTPSRQAAAGSIRSAPRDATAITTWLAWARYCTRADVVVEPANDFLDDLAALGHEDLVAAGIEHVLLVRARRAQCLEERLLRRLKGKDEVLVAVQHEDRNSHPGRKGERIGLGRRLVGGKTTHEEHTRFDARVEREDDWSKPPAPREAVVGQPGAGKNNTVW